MRVAFLAYHKNLNKIYPAQWIEQYKDSVLNQSYRYFDILEHNYGGGEERIFSNSFFESKPFPSFIHCMNYMLDKAFEQGYDCVFNSNCDDTVSLKRIETQLPYIKDGYDLVSSNFCLVQDGIITHYHKFHNLDLQEQLSHDHNIIAHPVVAYSKEFWRKNRYIPEEFPKEDLKLWQRAIKNSKFYVCEENLLYHRIHSQSVCKSQNR